ncbi:ABC transporter ATP-binding protein [Geopsychrobacter electrodiphilus]|uniref:ABC transporter ATP-binding protein n=1 Tax=Geopsychrobacter electrodiphilus TaxID=225196 RepID=UPI00037234C6|nr:ABC transporter ATP-binding protein [Geopsychrobacter electrodiphilus]
MALLEVKQVTKRFGGLVAVNDVSLTVEEGQIIGIIGPNGAGKTTLFNCIAGAFPPSDGQIKFEGQEIGGKKPHQICKLGLSRTFQVVKPFASKTVLYNVTVGAFAKTSRRSEAEAKALKVLEFLQMADKKDVLAKHLTLPERKRLELARALATEPTMLLLDEVMAGLRFSEIEVMIEVLKKIRAAGVTLVIVEHIMQAIMSLSDHIYVLNFGGLIAQGAPAEIAQNQEVIKAYLGDDYVTVED